jgi:FAD:protein FMN transferase
MIGAAVAAEVTASRRPGTLDTRRFTGRAMSSPITLTTIIPTVVRSPSIADRAWSAVVDEFESSEQALSRFRQMSEVTQLNQAAQHGEALAVDRRLAIAVHACDRAHRITARRFDPRIIGQLDAWGYRGARLERPVALTSLAASERIMEREDRDRIRLPHPIDLGGIGKGLAVRWAADRVRRAGVDRFLLDAGGDIAARGEGPDGGPWLIGVEDPSGGSDPVAVVAIRNGAIATSSIRRLRWSVDGRERHHLVDPATGGPADGGLLAVTVAGPDPAWAEVWSKALFITGRDGIGAEARARGLAAWWVGSDGTVEMTPAARITTVWVAGEA